MAEENKILFDLEIKGTDQELAQLQALNAEIVTLKEEIKAAGKESTKANEERKAQLKDAQAEYRKVQKSVLDRNKAEKDGADTLEKMRARLRNMNKELDKTPINTKRFKDLTEQSKKLRDEIKGADEATGRFQGNVGNYKNAILDAFSQMGVNVSGITKAMNLAGDATKTTTLGVGGLSGALKILKLAIASTGIGLLVVALGSLVTYFQSTEEGAAKLQKILSPFKILFGNIAERAADFGEKIVAAFENPKQAVADLWEAIKQNFVNRINGVIKVAKGLGAVLEGVWELDRDKINAGFKDAGAAMLDVITGVEDAATKATDIVGGFIKEVAEETRIENEKNLEVIDRQLALDKQRRAFKVEEAKIEAEISEQRLIANDRSKTAVERQAAINAAIALNTQLAEKRKAIEEEDLALLELRASFSDSDAATLDEIADKKAGIVRLDKRQADAAREMVSLRETINTQLEAELKTKQDIIDIDTDDADEIAAEIEKERMMFVEKEKVQQQITDMQLTEFEKRQAGYDYWLQQGYITEQQYADLTKQLNKEVVMNKLDLASEALSQLRQFAGEETAVGKAAAVAQAIISTYKGVASSLEMGMPIGAIFAALSLAAGLANVQKILAVDTNVNKKYARGVIGLDGPGSETSDSITAKLSRGESVVTAKATKVYAPVLAEMERSVGNTPNFEIGSRRYASGFIPKMDFQSETQKIITETVNAIGEIPVVVSENDITATQGKVRNIKVTGDL